MTVMAPQHQHYVPKLLLRGFLSRDISKAKQQQVHVFDFENECSFPASICKIMGETRFNDFWVDDRLRGTIEPWTSRIESHLAPLVDRIRVERLLKRTGEERTDLSLLVAFQLLRTKKMRLLPERINSQIRRHVRSMGLSTNRIAGLVDFNADGLKFEHIRHQTQSMTRYVELIAEKEFFLIVAPKGHSFYISDHPVVFHNDEPQSLRTGHLGIGAAYIQIYLPLSADVVLCAFDKAVLGQMMKSADEVRKKEVVGPALSKLIAGMISPAQMKEVLEFARAQDPVVAMIEAIRAGKPIEIGPEQVQWQNSLQAFYAHRFVIDPDDSFIVAREMINERELVEADEHTDHHNDWAI